MKLCIRAHNLWGSGSERIMRRPDELGPDGGVGL